jgi:hypothetical protein
MAQSHIFRGVARNIVKDNGITKYYYHNTPIVQVLEDGRIKLFCDGWFTKTTKVAMNQASNQFDLGFGVYQRKNQWYVDWKGATFDFVDGMVLESHDGFVSALSH